VYYIPKYQNVFTHRRVYQKMENEHLNFVHTAHLKYTPWILRLLLICISN